MMILGIIHDQPTESYHKIDKIIKETNMRNLRKVYQQIILVPQFLLTLSFIRSLGLDYMVQISRV